MEALELEYVQQAAKLQVDDQRVISTVFACGVVSGFGLPIARYLQCSTIAQIAIGSLGGLSCLFIPAYGKCYRRDPVLPDGDLRPTDELEAQYGHLPAYWKIIDITQFDKPFISTLEEEKEKRSLDFFLESFLNCGTIPVAVVTVAGLGQAIQGHRAWHMNASIFAVCLLNFGIALFLNRASKYPLLSDKISCSEIINRHALWKRIETELREKLTEKKVKLSQIEIGLFFPASDSIYAKDPYAFSALTQPQLKNLNESLKSLSRQGKVTVWVKDISDLDSNYQYNHLIVRQASRIQSNGL